MYVPKASFQHLKLITVLQLALLYHRRQLRIYATIRESSCLVQNATLEPVSDYVLGVSHSASGRPWLMREVDERAAMAMAQRCRVPESIARVMAARGVMLEAAENFLNPSLKIEMPDPSVLKGMDEAAALIARMIRDKQPIGILGDYDVDGGTSTALLLRFFRALGVEAHLYIPDRMKEGYGPNVTAMERLSEQGAKCVIAVDCGTVAFAPIARARELGMEVVVLDHHIGEPELPEAIVVNPNRFDESDEGRALGHLAAVGVCFMCVVAVVRALRKDGFFVSNQCPDLMQWLDLVALGTVCDVVPLTGLNRAFVAQGLKVMAHRQNLGITALSDIGRLDEAPTSYHAGFVIGPRINAGGRVGKSDLGARILSCTDATEAAQLAQELDQHNKERQTIEQMVLEEAGAQLEGKSNMPVLFAAGEGWHPGVIGIVAGRLKERYYRPVAVIAWEETADGVVGKASARSIPGVDFGSAVNAARQRGLLIAGGGHAMAAGFTVAADKLDDLHAFFCERMGAAVDAAGDAPPLKADAIIAPSALTMGLVQSLSRVGPFGQGNPEPRLIVQHAHIVQVDPLKGGEHLRLIVTEGESMGRTSRVKAMAFRVGGTPLGEALMQARGQKWHLAGKAKINRWQGRESVDFHIEDAAMA